MFVELAMSGVFILTFMTSLIIMVVRGIREIVKKKDYAKLEIINHLFQELCEDYDFYSYETQNGEEAAAFSAHCSSTLRDVRIRTACGTSLFFTVPRSVVY